MLCWSHDMYETLKSKTMKLMQLYALQGDNYSNMYMVVQKNHRMPNTKEQNSV